MEKLETPFKLQDRVKVTDAYGDTFWPRHLADAEGRGVALILNEAVEPTMRAAPQAIEGLAHSLTLLRGLLRHLEAPPTWEVRDEIGRCLARHEPVLREAGVTDVRPYLPEFIHVRGRNVRRCGCSIGDGSCRGACPEASAMESTGLCIPCGRGLHIEGAIIPTREEELDAELAR